MEINWLEVVDLSSAMLLVVKKEIECLFGGAPDADKLWGNPGGVKWGMLD